MRIRFYIILLMNFNCLMKGVRVKTLFHILPVEPQSERTKIESPGRITLNKSTHRTADSKGKRIA